MDQTTAKSISFSGGGFNGIYHFGVARYMLENKEKFNNFKDWTFLGASAGSIVGPFILTHMDNTEFDHQLILTIASKMSKLFQRNSITHTVHKTNEYTDYWINTINEQMYNEYIHGKNKCYISISELNYGVIPYNRLINQFDNYEHFTNVFKISCSIPLVIDNQLRILDGKYCVDGGFSDNIPIIDKNTIIVTCAFSSLRGKESNPCNSRAKRELLGTKQYKSTI
jgi:predicted acylesterase/phospholipase RssA